MSLRGVWGTEKLSVSHKVPQSGDVRGSMGTQVFLILGPVYFQYVLLPLLKESIQEKFKLLCQLLDQIRNVPLDGKLPFRYLKEKIHRNL